MPEFGEGGGAAKTDKIKFFFLETVSVEFKSDHTLMLDDRKNYRKKGSRYPKPEWTRDKQHERVPISHSKQKTLELEAEFVATTDSPKSAQMTGEIPSGFVLEASGSATFPPDDKVKVKFKSAKPVPDTIKKIRTNFNWDAKVEGEYSIVTPSGKHVLYITWGDPIDEGLPEDGVTHRRMNKSVKWVGQSWSNGKREPVEIVDDLFGRYEGYVLGLDYLPKGKRQYLAKNPKVLKALTKSGFATYTNAAEGGAWPLAHFQAFGGECQAIARLIRGIIHQLGMPGTAEVKYVNADASAPYTAIIRGVGTQCTGPRPDRSYALVDSPVQKGGKYPEDGSIGWNNYEAYLKFTHGKEYWYGGGIGRLPDGHDPLKVFFGLAEFKSSWQGKQYVREVTRVWKYNGH